MSKLVTPSAILFYTTLILLIAFGQNLDAGRTATAVASAIGAFLCLVAACVKEAEVS